MSFKLNAITGNLDLVGGSSSSPVVSVIYFGDTTTNGSWRIRINGSNLVQERLESGVWVEKVAATP